MENRESVSLSPRLALRGQTRGMSERTMRRPRGRLFLFARHGHFLSQLAASAASANVSFFLTSAAIRLKLQLGFRRNTCNDLSCTGYVRSGSKSVRLSASTSRLQFSREQTLLTHVGTSPSGQQRTFSHIAVL